jgi:hypothetical protein
MLKKISRWMLFVVACLVTLVALFYAEEDWRGKHAWDTYQREREAKGDSFEWSSIVPPPVPDNENFAAIPFFAGLFPKPTHSTELYRIGFPTGCTNKWGNWRLGRMEDLSGWPGCFSNTDLRVALSKYEPILQQITDASRRPYCRFPIRYEDSFAALLPHLNSMRQLARVYRLRALAELSAGETDAALQDVQTSLRLVDKLKDEPVPISFLVRVGMLDLITQPIWEGLVAHRWTDGQLAALQMQLEEIDQLESSRKALQGGRIFACHTILWLCDHRSGLPKWVDYSPKPDVYSEAITGWPGQAAPSGWFYQNQRNLDRFYAETLLPTVDRERHRINPSAVERIDQSIKTLPITPYNVLFRWLSVAITGITKKAALSQTYVDETVVACALERYRLAHGSFPETLDPLVPQFINKLPHDVIDGEPLHYRHAAADQYLLYSVGWNEKDDGGQIAMDGVNQNFDDGDWVWFSQPQPQPPASERK